MASEGVTDSDSSLLTVEFGLNVGVVLLLIAVADAVTLDNITLLVTGLDDIETSKNTYKLKIAIVTPTKWTCLFY